MLWRIRLAAAAARLAGQIHTDSDVCIKAGRLPGNALTIVLLEIRTVSHKTPRDGKLEILPETADRLARLSAEFPIDLAGGTSSARVSTMACTCEKGAGATHVHAFVESVLLKALRPGTQVRIELDALGSRLRVSAAPGH